MTALVLIFSGSLLPDFFFALQTAMIAHGRRFSVGAVDFVAMVLSIVAIGLTVKTLSFGSVVAYAAGGSAGTVLGLYADPMVEALVARLFPAKEAA